MGICERKRSTAAGNTTEVKQINYGAGHDDDDDDDDDADADADADDDDIFESRWLHHIGKECSRIWGAAKFTFNVPLLFVIVVISIIIITVIVIIIITVISIIIIITVLSVIIWG